MQLLEKNPAIGLGPLGGRKVCAAPSVSAGDIRGMVTDPVDALIPGVTPRSHRFVLNQDTGVIKDYTTNAAAFDDTDSIISGHYPLTFKEDGLESMVGCPSHWRSRRISAQLRLFFFEEAICENNKGIPE